jgi:acetylglutamate kinase
VGRIVSVRADVLLDLCAQGVVPVISPISVGPGGRYNVNADHAAGAIAGAVGAVRAVFVTNVPGVQLNSRVVAQLTAGGAHRLIAEGVIHGGMIPKVSAALNALACGAREAVVTDLRGLHSGVGTSFVA